MLSILSPLAGGRPNSIITTESLARFAELVNKIGTSPATALRKRKTAARKKVMRIIGEQRKYAGTANLRAVALTLTYRDAKLFCSKHISTFLDRLRRALKRLGHSLPYIWVLERASQFHYHLILWLPRNYILDPAKLAKWWTWGSTWVESCRSVKAWGRYMAKFDSIQTLPKGARLYGYGGLDDAGTLALSRATLPRWLQGLLPAGHRARRCPGVGWADMTTGEIYRSPYVWTPRGAVLATASRPTYH